MIKRRVFILKPENGIDRVLHVVGIIQMIAGLIIGIYLGKMNLGILLGSNGFSWSFFFFSLFNGIISGLIFIAVGEGVRLLAVIANRIKEFEFNVQRIKNKYYEQG